MQSGSEVAAYRYDAIARRIVKTVDEESYHLYYDTQWRVLDEWVDGAVKSQYVWSPFDRWSLIRRQRVTSGSSFNETYYVLRDYLDPVAIVTTNGTVAERYRYEAFGPATKLSPTFTTPLTSSTDWTWLFHGEFIDLETGLYNYGYRYYHPQLGRWISRDPIGEKGGNNLYLFVDNQAIKNIDILGLVSSVNPQSLAAYYATALSEGSLPVAQRWLASQGVKVTIRQIITVIRAAGTADDLANLVSAIQAQAEAKTKEENSEDSSEEWCWCTEPTGKPRELPGGRVCAYECPSGAGGVIDLVCDIAECPPLVRRKMLENVYGED